MPITVKEHWRDDVVTIELVAVTPDRYLVDHPDLAPWGPLHAVDWRSRADLGDLAALGLHLVHVDRDVMRAVDWYADRSSPEWRWIVAAFRLRDAYWWMLSEVLYRRLHVIVPRRSRGDAMSAP